MREPAKSIVRYLSGLTLTGGDCDGERFNVLPWERKFICGTFGQPGNSALSVARGNGKSAVVAGIATAVVDPAGPLHGRRREAVCVASSFEQSRVIFEDVLAFLGERYDLGKRTDWKKTDSAQRAVLEHKATGSRVRCIGSDPARAHGMRPFLALADEPAQWPRNTRDRMRAAIRTGLGKVPGSRMVALGTRANDPAHWFSKLLAGGAGYAQVHAASADDPPFHLRTWRKANPSLTILPSLLETLRLEAGEASADAALLPSFNALRLNLGTADVERNSLLDAATWAKAEAGAGEPLPGGSYALGIDLGAGAAMSAAAAYWPDSGRLEAVAMLPSVPDLKKRGLRDGVGSLYLDMQARGELLTVPGAWVPVSALLGVVADRWGHPAAIAADRWREAELRQGLTDARFPLAALALRGQGFKDGAADVREFRKAVLCGAVRPVKSLLLRSAMSEAVTVADAAGNEKLAKATQGGRRSRGRDDAVAAAILAVAEGIAARRFRLAGDAVDGRKMSRNHERIPYRLWRRLRAQILHRDNWRCQVCGRPAGRAEVDHIEPLQDGGATIFPENLQTICRGCHIDKTRRENRRPDGPQRAAWRALTDELR